MNKYIFSLNYYISEINDAHCIELLRIACVTRHHSWQSMINVLGFYVGLQLMNKSRLRNLDLSIGQICIREHALGKKLNPVAFANTRQNGTIRPHKQ